MQREPHLEQEDVRLVAQAVRSEARSGAWAVRLAALAARAALAESG